MMAAIFGGTARPWSHRRPAGEQLLAAAEEQRVQPQVQPVDETQTQQRLHEVEAANEVDVVMTLLEGGDAPGEVTGDRRRPVPRERLSQRSDGDVVGDAVDLTGERDVLGSFRPVVGEDLIGPSAEQQGVHALCLLEHGVAGLLVQQWCLPPAVREAAVAVLVGLSPEHAGELYEAAASSLA
jgi:hypothetical protein